MPHSGERTALEQVNLPEAGPLIYRKDFAKLPFINRLQCRRSSVDECLGSRATLVAACCFSRIAYGFYRKCPDR